MSALNFEALLTKDDFDRGIKSIKDSIREAAGIAKKETAEMDSAFKKLGIGISGYLSASALQGFIHQLINVRGEFQKTEIAFSTMLKSKEKARVLMGEMVDLAAKTPFGLQEVTDGAKRLLAFQIPAEQVTDILRRMGDVAAGLGVPMGQLIHVYGQVKAQGKLMTNDLYQFMNAGIPILAELGRVMGKTEAEIKKMVGEGKIGFAEVQQVIQNMTNEGGIFFNLMEAQSSSLSGKVANLKDTFEQTLNKIGESNEGLLADGIEKITEIVENYEDYVHILIELIAVYGTYKAALMVTSALQGKMVTPAIIQGFSNLIGLIKGTTSAQIALNAAGMANPYVLIATLLASLIAVTYNYRKELGELLGIIEKETVAQKTQIEVQKQYDEKFSAGVAEKQSKIQTLIDVIRNENATLDQRKQAYESLIAIDPSFRGTLDSQYKATFRLTDAFDAVIKKMQEFALAQAEMAVKAEALKKAVQLRFDEGRLKTQVNDVEKEINALRGKYQRKTQDGTIIIDLNPFSKDARKLGELVDKKKELAEQWEETNKVANEEARKYNHINKQTVSDTKKLNTEIEKLKKGLENKNITEDVRRKMQADLTHKQNLLNIKLGVNTDSSNTSSTPPTPPTPPDDKKNKNTKGNQRELAEVYSKDSIADLEERISLWNNALKRASKGEDGKLIVRERAKDKYGDEKETGNIVSGEYALEQLRSLEEKKRALEKELETKTFQEKINEAERHWNNYYKMAEYYGKESANTQYSELLKGSESYLAYLKKEAEALANKPGVLSDEDKENLIFLQDKIQNLSGAKTPLENWKSELADSLRGVTLLSEQIDIIDNKIKEVHAKEGESLAYLQFSKEAEAQKSQIENQISDMYHSVLESQKSFNEKSEALENERQMMLKKAKSKGERELIDKEYSSRTTDLFFNEMQKSEEWAKMFEDMNYVASEKLEEFKRILKKKLEEAKSIEEKMKIGEFIKRIDITLQSRNINPFKSFIDAFQEHKKKVKEAKEAQEKLNEAIKQFGAYSEQAKNAQKTLGIAMNGVSESKIKMAESLANGAGKALSYIGDAKSIVSDIQGAFDDLGLSLNNGFGDILDKAQGALDGMQQQMDGLMNIAEGIITKNPVKIVAGAVKAIAGYIKTVTALFNNDRKKERQIKKQTQALNQLKQAYEDLAHASKKALGAQKYDNSRDQIRNLEAQNRQLQEMARTEGSKKKADKGKIEEWNNQIEANKRAIDDLKTSIVEDVLQTDIAGAAAKVGDALVDAFSRGEDAAKALKATADDMVRDVLKNQLNLMLQGRMKGIMNDLLKSAGFNDDGTGSFNGLSKEEIERFRNDVANAGQQMQGFLEASREIFQGDGLETDSLKGAFKGMSEETGGVLVGQFNAIRINTADALRIWKEFQNKNFGLDIARNSLLSLVNIERYTSNLESIKKDISELNAKVKSDGGIRAGGF